MKTRCTKCIGYKALFKEILESLLDNPKTVLQMSKELNVSIESVINELKKLMESSYVGFNVKDDKYFISRKGLLAYCFITLFNVSSNDVVKLFSKMCRHANPVKADVSKVPRLLVNKLLESLEANSDRNGIEFTYIDDGFIL